jgi:hypothetical protein
MQLSADEFSVVLKFLSVGETIMLALTCREWFSIVTKLIKEKHSISLGTPWSISNALRSEKITLNQLPVLIEYIVVNGLDKITNSLTIDAEYAKLHANQLHQIFSIPLPNHIDTISLPAVELSTMKSCTAEFKPVNGHLLKKLQVKFLSASQHSFYRLLVPLLYLESLIIGHVVSDAQFSDKENYLPKVWYENYYDGYNIIQSKEETTVGNLLIDSHLEWSTGTVYVQENEKSESSDTIAIRKDTCTLFPVSIDTSTLQGCETFSRATSQVQTVQAGSYIIYKNPLSGALPIMNRLKTLIREYSLGH